MICEGRAVPAVIEEAFTADDPTAETAPELPICGGIWDSKAEVTIEPAVEPT